MILTLKQPNAQFPPGGFGFVDPKTKRAWLGYEGTPEMHAAQIMIHRQGNPDLYPKEERQWFDKNSIVQEIYQQKFAKMPWLFSGQPGQVHMDVPVVNNNRSNQPMKSSLGSCTCGSDMVFPVYCQTCSGNRVTHYTCVGCGKERRA